MIRPRSVEVVATATQLNIFLPAGPGGKSSEWQFRRWTNSTKHVDKWAMNYLYAASRIGDYSYARRLGGNPIVSDQSTWEHAVQVRTAGVDDADFSGGQAHGWQKLTSVTFFIDGVPWTPATKNFRCRNLRIVQQCDLFRWKATTGESEDLIAKTTEVFNFSLDGLTLRQSIRFSTSLNLGTAYLGMWPLLRSITGPPAYTVTSYALRNNDGTPEDISVSGYTQKLTVKTDRVLMYDTDAEICADWQQTLSTGSEVNTFISNSVFYNKLYRAACAANAAVTSTTAWETEHKYSLST